MPSNPLERELPSENDLELGVTGTGTRTGTATEQGPVSPSSRDQSRHGPLQRQDSVAASSYTSIGSSSSSSSSSSTIVDDDEDEGGNPVVALIGSVANLCSATLGAGILALPFAFYQAGIICGVLLLVTSALATSFSIGLLAETCDRYNLSTYEKIVERGLGRTARKIVEVSILVFCCGTAVGYVIAVGDIIQRVVPYTTPSQKRVATSAVWCVAMLPLSCLRKMKSLECASSVGILSIGTLLAAAVVHLLRGDGDGNSDSDLYGYYDADAVESTSVASLLGPAGGSWMSVLRACPIFFYAFSCQVNVAQIFDELPQRALARAVAADGSRTSGSSSGGGSEKPKLAAMRRVTSAGVWVCGLLYAGVSLVTLVDFGSSVQPNILSNYDLSGGSGSGSGGGGGAQPLLHVAFLGMALAVVMAFPLNVFPARVSLIQMWEERQKENYSHSHSHSHSPPTEPGDVRQPLLSVENRRQNRNGNGNGNRAVGGLDYNSDGETDAAATATATSCSITTAPAPEEALPLHERHGHDDTTAGGDDDDDDDDGEFRFARHALVTLLLAGMALGLALVVPNISLVFGLLGGTTSSLLGFVVPGLLGLQQDRNRIGAWILVICGSIVGVLTTGVTIYSVFRHS